MRMELTDSSVMEAVQLPVSIGQLDPPDLRISEHGPHPNVNIDHGSTTTTTHLHGQSNTTRTTSSNTHSCGNQDYPASQLHTKSSSSQITPTSGAATSEHYYGQTDPYTGLHDPLEIKTTFTPTHLLPDQTADSSEIALVSRTSQISSTPELGYIKASDSNEGKDEDDEDDFSFIQTSNGQTLFEEQVENQTTWCVTVETCSNDQSHDHTQDSTSDSLASNDHIYSHMETDMDTALRADLSCNGTVEDGGEKLVNKFDVESLSYELQVGYKILMSLMGAGNRCVNKLFLYPVDDKFPETSEYYNKISKPMWMGKMKEKIESLQYTDLTDFMADFRLMIENCYRFNGPDNFVSKKAQKLEMMMKQKIALLSKDLRDKLLGSVGSDDDILTSAGIRRRIRNPNLLSEDPSQQLLSQLRRDKVLQEREDRRQRTEDKKAVEQARIQEIQDWEDDFMGQEIKEDLRTMWEIPQIGLFVYLCMETLGLDEEITQYQLERGLVAPRESHDFKRLMTCLMSTPHQRKSLKTFMPYHVWNSKLTQKVCHFYKILLDYNGNHQQACYKLGLDNRAFKVMGKRNPMLKKSFHELAFHKRVWIVKSFCDFCLETQSPLQKTIEEVESERPMDVREVLLGSDGRGYRYINFPMFTGKDIRIYRHSKLAEPNLKSLGLEDWSMAEDKPSNASSRCSTPVNPRSQRLYEQPSSSLRARAILQAAESKEASPMRDISRTGSDFHDENSNSNMDADSVSSELIEGSGKKAGKKRKRSSYYGGKRKKFKGASKKIVLEESVDSPNTEKEEEEGGGERGTSASLVASKVEKEEATKVTHEEKRTCDKAAPSGDCDLHKNLLSSLPSEFHPELSEEVSDSESQNIVSSNPANLFNNYATDVEKKSVNSPSDPALEKMGKENTFSSVNNDVKNHDSAYLSCDSDKSFKTEDGTDISKAPLKMESGMNVNERNVGKENISDGNKSPGKGNIDKSVDSQKKDAIKSDDEVKKEVNSVSDDKTGVTKSNGPSAKPPHGDGSPSSLSLKAEVKEELDLKEAKKEETEVKSEETPMESEQGKEASEIKEEVVEEEEESDDEELPDLGHIELIAESMEEIRQLIHKLSNPDPIKRGKRVYPGVIKPCEEELHDNLSRFHDELTKYERSLFNARIHAQVKLRKEIENYAETKLDDGKGWESENSQTSKETSDDEDLEPKKETSPKEKPKRSKSKAAAAVVTTTSELLSSAVSKLSSFSGDANEDSNDSYELDISSRGRLRKRRVIPNNTEDTGLKKRKNLLNQDLPSVSASSSTSPSSNAAASSSSDINTIIPAVSSTLQQQSLKSWPQQLLSLVSSSNSAIKAQLTTPAKSGMPCQIVQLVSPSGDASYKTVHVAGKRNVVLSSESMANIRFISSTGVFTVPKNSLLTSSASAHSSHPVIQQLLLNQTRRPVTSTLPAGKSITGNVHLPPQTGVLQSLSGTSVMKTQSSSTQFAPGHVKVTLVTPSSQDSNVMTTAKTPSTTAVVVTQVSTSIISQGGKQILDLGSLSVTQIQQLVKNQAIQINTGAGSPTTLLLTKGLQQLATSKLSTFSSSTTVTSATANSIPQVRMSGQQNQVSKPGDVKDLPTSSLVSVPSGNNKVQVVTIPGTINSQTGSMTVLSGRQVAPHLPVIRTIINRPIQNASLIRAVNPSVMGASIPVSHVITGAARLPTVSQGTFTVVPGGSVLSRQVSTPRIISSLPSPSVSLSSMTGQTSANKENPPIPINAASGADRQNAELTDTKKPSFVNIPFTPHSSPQKKYASNVTVKALLENRTLKKSDNDCSAIQGKVPNVPGPFSKPIVSGNSQEAVSLSLVSSCLTVNSNGPISVMSSSLLGGNAQSESVNIPSRPIQSVQDVKGTDGQGCSLALSHGLSSTSSASTHSQSLSVDTAIQPLLSSSVQVTLPTVNIKVPSPNTLPSLTHNKNSTIIVQSTKVPIPVASAEDTSRIDDSSNLYRGNQLNNKPLISSAARMVVGTPDSLQTTISGNPACQTSTHSTIVNPKAVPVSSPGAMSVKNVMLKLTPPKGAVGQFVQGFMTSKGKLVIPQNALLQPHPQQLIQASPNRVILANASYNSQLQTNPLQVRPAQVVGNLINQNVVKNVPPFSQNSVLQPIQQQNGQVIIASQSAGTMSGVSAQTIPIQNGNPGIKVMLINQSNVAQLQQGQSGVGGDSGQTSSISNALTRQPPLHTSTPASELVKQIANSTQLLASAQQQSSKTSSSSIQQNMVNNAGSSMINFNTSQTSVPNLSVQNIAGQVTIKSGQGQANVSPQLAAQILALQQQSGKGLQVKQVQQQQTGIVLASAKPASVQQQQQTQSPVMAVQLQQLGNQLLPGVGGIAQVQVPSSQLQQAAAQIATAQTPLGAKTVQPGQVVQLALNSQAANPNSTVIGQPQAQIVQVAGQLSPHVQVANQNMSHLPQQGNLIFQQPNIIQNQQQAVVRTQNTSVLPMQVNNLNQQKAAQPLKQQLVGGVTALTQQPQLQGNQAQIQLVLNPSIASSMPLSIGTVLRKPTPVSAVNVPQLTSTQQIMRAIVNPAAGTSSSAISTPRLLSPTKPTLPMNSSPQTILGTTTQLSQVMTQNLVNANQLLISPVKLAPQMSQMHRNTPIKFNPSPGTLQLGSTSGPITSQVVQKTIFNSSNQALNVSQGGIVTQKPVLSSGTINTNASLAPVGTEKIAHRLLSQSGGRLVSVKQPIGVSDPSLNVYNNFSGLTQLSLPASQGVVTSIINSSIAPVASNPTIVASSLPVHPAVSLKQNPVAVSSVQPQQVITATITNKTSHNSAASTSMPAGDKVQLSFANVSGNKMCDATQLSSYCVSSSVDLSNGEGQLSTGNDLAQENGRDINEMSSDTSLVEPSKSGSVRRNTFSGSQDNPRAAVQRNTSVDESSSSPGVSKEMDEKEAALNLLTLANQPM